MSLCNGEMSATYHKVLPKQLYNHDVSSYMHYEGGMEVLFFSGDSYRLIYAK